MPFDVAPWALRAPLDGVLPLERPAPSSEILVAARARIRAGWARGAFARIGVDGPWVPPDHPAATHFCAVGAVAAELTTLAAIAAIGPELTYLQRATGRPDIIGWNDSADWFGPFFSSRWLGRRRVLRGFDRAIALARADEMLCPIL